MPPRRARGRPLHPIYAPRDDTFREVVRNSLIFTVGSVALKILTGLAMALVLNDIRRWRNLFRGLFLLPWITSTVIIALTWRWMFDAFPGRGFFYALVFIQDERSITVPVGLNLLIYGDVFHWGQLMAASVITTVPVVALYCFIHRWMVEGLAAGSVKG